MSSMHSAHASRAFTLIELLVVIAIIGLLSSVVLASLNSAREKAQDAKRHSDIAEVNTALQLYYLDHNAYPSTGSLNAVYMDPTCVGAGATDKVTADWVPGLVAGGYIGSLPEDPTGKNAANGGSGGTCYMYSSDGKQYLLSAWGTVTSAHTSGGQYSRMGFREGFYNMQDARVLACNYQGSNIQTYYQHSYTYTNIPCSW